MRSQTHWHLKRRQIAGRRKRFAPPEARVSASRCTNPWYMTHPVLLFTSREPRRVCLNCAGLWLWVVWGFRSFSQKGIEFREKQSTPKTPKNFMDLESPGFLISFKIWVNLLAMKTGSSLHHFSKTCFHCGKSMLLSSFLKLPIALVSSHQSLIPCFAVAAEKRTC